jgi:hypothetical protein
MERVNESKSSGREIVALSRMVLQVTSSMSSRVRTTLIADPRRTVRPGSVDANAVGRRALVQLMLSGRATLCTAPQVNRRARVSNLDRRSEIHALRGASLSRRRVGTRSVLQQYRNQSHISLSKSTFTFITPQTFGIAS